jgi:hypothetical protein
MDKNEITKLLAEATSDLIFEIIRSDKPPEEIIEQFRPTLLKKIFPDKYLVTLEMPTPASATIMDVTYLVEKELPGSVVVHIEKLERRD